MTKRKPLPPPTLVFVVGVPYDVKVLHRLPSALRDEAELAGHVDGHNLRLWLDGTAHPAAMRVTFLHELLHACLQVLDYKSGPKNDNEEVVKLLAPALVQLLRVNPGVVPYLLDHDDT